MEIKLKFRDNFQSFASIKNTFEIRGLKAFSVLSGVNGIGKSQFLKAISGGYVDVEIDGTKLCTGQKANSLLEVLLLLRLS
ncbi:MAG: hypothetical protein F6K11_37550 [Leptolyngbya sp. SIO3F4]|nr:hypothetical protein [Leptolyngbya sp. SIO3F4]